MNNILNGRFISALTPDNNQNNNSANLADLFNEFRDNLLIICKTTSYFEELFMLLTELSGILSYAIDTSVDKKEIFYISRAIYLVKGHLKLLNRRKLNPEPKLRKENASVPNKSKIYWGGTQTELAELIVALDSANMIKGNNNSKIIFTELVSSFETAFNTKLAKPHEMKRKILNRKTHLTVFLDRLRGSF